jgi:hypothetical protein
VNLGYRPSSLLGEEFLSAPIHSILSGRVTPDFPKKTKCISYVRQDQVYTYMIDVMSEISINSNKNVQELNHYIIFYYTQTIDSKVFTTIKR